ncbi:MULTISPECIES: hypothetical protein [unclassified Thioalkalivibrio]|uniref:hypothetical protein n=1 Tax=unclassified Thioalkalivibrio TaxID=2621013 RepID=UPI0003620CA2|nr:MULTISPECIES: hypothetical protein [unclassified Thioalkalivibrio]
MGTFTYTDEDGSVVTAKTAWFVERAIREALAYDDPKKLHIAIAHGLPELLSPENREALAAIVEGRHRRRGYSPDQRRRNDDRDRRIFAEIHRLIGQGVPLDSKGRRAPGETAQDLAAERFSVSRKTVDSAFSRFGGLNPTEPHATLTAQLQQHFGTSEKK